MRLAEFKDHQRELHYFQLRIGIAGAGGLTSSYYDWDKDEYKKDLIDVSTMHKTSLASDFIVDRSEMGKSHRFMYSGRDSNHKATGYARLFHKLEKSLKMMVVVFNNGEAEVGDKVEVTMPKGIPGNSETHGGKWVVYRKITYIKTVLMTKYVLIRDSFQKPISVKDRNFVPMTKVG